VKASRIGTSPVRGQPVRGPVDFLYERRWPGRSMPSCGGCMKLLGSRGLVHTEDNVGWWQWRSLPMMSDRATRIRRSSSTLEYFKLQTPSPPARESEAVWGR
jgi:hypothetical protein